MPKSKTQSSVQGERQALEIEANQKALRESISETERLVDESEKMLRRHREERDNEK